MAGLTTGSSLHMSLLMGTVLISVYSMVTAVLGSLPKVHRCLHQHWLSLNVLNFILNAIFESKYIV